MGYVYLAASTGARGLLKIGHTNANPRKRIAQLQTGNPLDVYLVYAISTPDPIAVERHLHKRFNAARIRGEWFKITVREAKQTLYEIAKDVAQIDAQKDLEYFINSIGGDWVDLLMWFSWMSCLALGTYLINVGNEKVVINAVGIILMLASTILMVTAREKLKRKIFRAQIVQKAREIESEYMENYGVRVTLE